MDAPAPVGLRWAPSAAAVGIIAALFAGQIGLAVASGFNGSAITVATGPLWGLVVSSAALQLVTGGVPIVASSRLGSGPRADLRLTASPVDLPLGAVLGVATQLLVIPALYWPLKSWISTEDLEGPARDLVSLVHGSGDRVLLVLMVCVGAPIAEELMFRGLLLRGLATRLGLPWAVVVSSVVFGLVHLQAVQLPGLIAFGLVSGTLAARTGRIAPGIVAHSAFNAVTIVTLLR